jgi:3-oxoacyl-[acyl-carrier protein] reductase
MMTLEGKVAIVTGAANGIGRSISQLLAREGAQLALVDLDQAALDGAVRKLRNDNRQAVDIIADVSDEKDVKRTVAATLEEFGTIDILVNCAGICRMIPILEIEVAEWDRIMAVNLRSVFLFGREVFRHMKAKRSGKIINIASAAGKIGGIAAGAHYSASKAGVMCFTKSLALQAAPYGINVNAVCPGPTKTEMTDAWGEEENQAFAAKIPFREYGTPEDTAQAVLFLASERARYITGEILDVNGGLVMD